jgi:predicted HicB family RNase H-like nuclease
VSQKPAAPQLRRTERILHTLLVFRCPTTLSERLAQVATQRQTSMSAVIRQLLTEGLKAG